MWLAETNWTEVQSLAVLIAVSPLLLSVAARWRKISGYALCELIYFIEPLEHPAVLRDLSFIALLLHRL